MSLPAQAQVDRQVRTEFPVVLDEQLRAFGPGAEFRLIAGVPAAQLSQQEVRILYTVPVAGRTRDLAACGGVQATEAGGARIREVVQGRIVEADQELAAEMHNVASANQRDHVGWIVDELLVDEGEGTIGARTRHTVAGREAREKIRLGELVPEHGWITQASGLRQEEIHLVGKAQSRFVDEGRAVVPYIGDLRIVAANILVLAINGAELRSVAEKESGVIALRHRSGKPVIPRD